MRTNYRSIYMMGNMISQRLFVQSCTSTVGEMAEQGRFRMDLDVYTQWLHARGKERQGPWRRILFLGYVYDEDAGQNELGIGGIQVPGLRGYCWESRGKSM